MVGKTFTIAGILIAIGLSLFAYRSLFLGFPVTPNMAAESWHIEAKLMLAGQDKPARMYLNLPRSSDRYTIVDESYVSNGFDVNSRSDPDTGNRVSEWIKWSAQANEMIYYRAILYEARQSRQSGPELPQIEVPLYGSEAFEELANEDRSYFLLKSLIGELRVQAEKDSDFIHLLFNMLEDGRDDERLSQLQEGLAGIDTQASLVVNILNHAGINARVMNGFPLQENVRNITLESWPEIYMDGQWLSYDAEKKELVANNGKMAWWSGTGKLYEIDGARVSTSQISVRQHVENALTESIWQGHPARATIYKFSIFSLPIDVQIVFAVLMLVPLGALAVSFMRQVVGIHTYGIFMPVLIALAFRETQLLWGLFIFTFIVAIGMVCRFYLDKLQLLLVPRLGAILTLVVMSIYLISIAAFNMGFHPVLSISLFPLVILTMLIERMSITWEEFGPQIALQTALGSMITAVMGYMVIANPYIAHLISTFPELLLLVLAMHMLIGRYNGYKILELYRFRMMR